MKLGLKIPRFTKGKKFKRSLIAVVIIIVITTPLYLFVRNLNSPSYGQIKPVLPSQTMVISDASYSSLTTSYFSLNYLDSYKLQAKLAANSGLLDHKVLVKSLTAPAGGTATLDISIKNLTPGNLVVDPNYTQYQTDPKHWNLSRKFYQSEPVDLAASISGPNQRGALWEHGNYLLVIRLSSDDPKQDLATEMKDILSSVQWNTP